MLTGTFRDPAGSLFDVQDRILRLIRPAETAKFESLLGHAVVRRLVERGDMVATRRVDHGSVPEQLAGLSGTWFGHDRIHFVSVPAEWSAAMLAQAALHTLDINHELLEHGMQLKDATPSNILFDGTRAVFVDVPSIEPLVAGRDLWLARHQFETTFLLPLLANLELGLPLKWSLADPATGLAHEQLARLFGPRRWSSLFRIRNVGLPAALSAVQPNYARDTHEPGSGATTSGGRLDKTQYVLGRAMASLRKSVLHLAERIEKRHSNWSGYATTRGHYSDHDLVEKREFVGQVLERAGARWVLDIGANTGEFSEMAAARSNVVAIDLDEVSVSAIHARARAGNRPIQPLVVNIAQPTPAAGWKYRERKTFLERAENRFDLALMLAVGHHLRVSAGVPLAEIVELGFALGQGSLLFEFVPAADPMFQTIARGRDKIYADYTVENCESLLAARGRIELSRKLANGRTLYWVRKAA